MDNIRTRNIYAPGYQLLLALGLAILLAGCGTAANLPAGEQPRPETALSDDSGPQAPSLQMGSANADDPARFADTLSLLREALEAQLPVGMVRQAASAPGGGNVVFDLSVMASEPPLDGSKVELRWTEVLIGDYDGNGEVSISDLVPLAKHYGRTVAYRPAEEAGGLAWWPEGNVDGGDPINWELARVDGNHDGLINISDVTNIAQHWAERLDGYLVYRSINGEEPQLLARPGQPENPLTIARLDSTRVTLNTRRYVFSDDISTLGFYDYFVKPYCLATEESGPPSYTATFLNAGELLAVLTADKSFGEIPLVVQFDASQSTTEFTQIVQYLWDFDGDGNIDEQTISPLASHVYETGGAFNCSVTVLDSGERMAEANLTILADGPPLALLKLDRYEIAYGESVKITADTIPGSSPIIARLIEITGPINFGIAFETDHYEITQPLGDSGLFRVRVVVTDSRNYVSEAIRFVNVLPLDT